MEKVQSWMADIHFETFREKTSAMKSTNWNGKIVVLFSFMDTLAT